MSKTSLSVAVILFGVASFSAAQQQPFGAQPFGFAQPLDIQPVPPLVVLPYWDNIERAWKLPKDKIIEVLETACKWLGHPLAPQTITVAVGAFVSVGVTYDLEEVCRTLGLSGAGLGGADDLPWMGSEPTAFDLEMLRRMRLLQP